MILCKQGCIIAKEKNHSCCRDCDKLETCNYNCVKSLEEFRDTSCRFYIEIKEGEE